MFASPLWRHKLMPIIFNYHSAMRYLRARDQWTTQKLFTPVVPFVRGVTPESSVDLKDCKANSVKPGEDVDFAWVIFAEIRSYSIFAMRSKDHDRFPEYEHPT
jgi:hypothetical protein